MNVLIAWVLVIALAVSGIGIVTIGSAPILEQTVASAAMNQAEQMMITMNSIVQSVSREGIGSSRIINVPSLQNGIWQFIPEEDMLEFRLSTSPLSTLFREIKNNIIYISGFDAQCSSGTWHDESAWIMENSYIKVYLQRVNGTIQTSKNILAVQSKATGETIIPTDSSIQIDDNSATSSGTGFSEMRLGTLPKCRVHFFVNSTVSYDIFYTLYSGADFVTVEVRNII